MRYVYHRWLQIIALRVTVLAIKSPVITMSVLWRAGRLLTNQGQLRWIYNWIIQCRRHRYHRWWKLIDIWVTFVAIKTTAITRSFFCLPWFPPVPLLWRLPIPFGGGTMNAIWVCGEIVCLLFCLLMTNKGWELNFWRDNCSCVWFSVSGIKLITRFLSQYHPN